MSRVAWRQVVAAHPGLQLHHLLRKALGGVAIGIEQLGGAPITARRAAHAQINAARGQSIEHAKLLGHLERRVMRQHHARAADADALGAGGNGRHQDFRGAAHDAGVAVVLTHPKAVVAPSFGLFGQRQSLENGGVLPAPFGGSRLVKDGKFQAHVVFVSGANAAISTSCNARHITLPLPLLGKASTKVTARGIL